MVLTNKERLRLAKAIVKARSKAKKKEVPAHERLVGTHLTWWLAQRLQKWAKLEVALIRVLSHIDRVGRRPEDRKCAERVITLLEDSLCKSRRSKSETR